MSATLSRIQDMPTPFIVVGSDGAVGYANAAAHRMLAYPAGSLLGKPLHQLTSSDAWNELSSEPVLSEHQRIRRLQSQLVRCDGSVVDVALTIEPALNEQNERTAFVLSYEPLPPWKVKRAG
jgi:PAS domain S-box-containing protein